MKTGMCTLVAGLLMLSPAYAEPTARDTLVALGGRHPDQYIKYYIHGIGTGIAWANSRLENKHMPRLYCEPEKVALTVEQEIDILERFVREYPKLGEIPVGAVLTLALMDAFPCK
jgi:hypothetical protein